MLAPIGFGVDDMGECVRSTINFILILPVTKSYNTIQYNKFYFQMIIVKVHDT